MIEQEIYEAWGLPNEMADTFSTVTGCADLKSKGLMDNSVALYSVRASSWSEAMTIYHEIQGWEPYKPMPED